MAVVGYTGLFGSGKTYAAVMEADRRRRKSPETPVMTNLQRLDLPGAPVHYLWKYASVDAMLGAMAEFACCDGIQTGQLHSAECNGRGAFLLLDEVGVYLNSRVWNRIPPELSWKWQQLRKDGIDLIWTCIRPANVVKDIRDITWETHWCESWKMFGFFVETVYSYTAVGEKKYYQGRSYRWFSPRRAGRLYDSMGKVKAPEWQKKRGTEPAGESAAG